MIVLAGTLRIPAEGREEILQALHTLQDATWENDDGVVAYHFSIDLKDENLIHVYEEWDSIPNLKAHGQKEHMNPFRALRTEKGVEVVRFSRWRAEELGKY
ncbi:MAG: antibiotic biosynthesis monooxygenase [Chloroflexota bacterium]